METDTSTIVSTERDCAQVYNAELLREILDAQMEMICRFSRDGTILFVNRAYADTLNSTPDQLTGRKLWAFVAERDRAAVEEQLASLTPESPKVQIENRFEAAAGTRWTLWRNSALQFDAEGRWLIAQSTGFDVTERKELEEQRQLLLDELNHRVRNTLMVVQGMAYQSFKGEDVPTVPLANFNARLHALAGAHTVLSRSNWAGASLAEVVRQGLTIAGGMGRIKTNGPDLKLAPAPAVALVLVLHELATNAVKYGALSGDGGRVRLEWNRRPDGWLELSWREQGGPPVATPPCTGFGTRLITASIVNQLGGKAEIDYAPPGLVSTFAFPLERGPGMEVADGAGR